MKSILKQLFPILFSARVDCTHHFVKKSYTVDDYIPIGLMKMYIGNHIEVFKQCSKCGKKTNPKSISTKEVKCKMIF